MAVTEAGRLASRAVDDLYRRHVAEVYRYAYAVLGNHADAEDVTQTTFLNAYLALEQGVRPRKPPNWLLTIASNAIKQRFRQEQVRPSQVELDERIARSESHDEGPSIGELLTALSKIPPQQRRAIVLREFEGRRYAEIAGILGVTTSALETLLFRARRSLADELERHLTCTDAQLAVSKSIDGRLGRKERRRLRDHLAECPDCAQFVRMQQRHRRALRGLMLIPIPLSLSMFKALEGAGTATAATMPVAPGAGASAAFMSAGEGARIGAAGASGDSAVAGGVTLKVAAVLAAASIAGVVVVAGASEADSKPATMRASASSGQRGAEAAPREAPVPGSGSARGGPAAPGQLIADLAAYRTGVEANGHATGQSQAAGAEPGTADSGDGDAEETGDGDREDPTGGADTPRRPETEQQAGETEQQPGPPEQSPGQTEQQQPGQTEQQPGQTEQQQPGQTEEQQQGPTEQQQQPGPTEQQPGPTEQQPGQTDNQPGQPGPTEHQPGGPPSASSPTAACKNGGWEAYDGVKNQGDCVSDVATQGKNEPGKNEPGKNEPGQNVPGAP